MQGLFWAVMQEGSTQPRPWPTPSLAGNGDGRLAKGKVGGGLSLSLLWCPHHEGLLPQETSQRVLLTPDV